MGDGSAIRLTTQRYYTPSGRSIQKDYEESNEEYFMEQFHRNDTIFPDSLKFKTKNGRNVFGGGGISPDIKISRDTTLNFRTINKIIINGWIRDFAMQYSDNNRNSIFQIKDSKEYLIRIEEIIYNQFLNFIKKNDKNIKNEISDFDKKYLKRQVIANIARNIWNNEDYYKIILDKDEYVISALKLD